MESGNLILAKKMAQSIIKDGFVRDTEMFNDISVVLKQASDDSEAKALLNRINLIRISTLNRNVAPVPPQNTTPVQEKVTPPVEPKIVPQVEPKIVPPVQAKVEPPVQPKYTPPVQPKPMPPVQERVNPPVPPRVVPPVQARNIPVQPRNTAQVQSKNAPVQNKAVAPVQPKVAAPNQVKTITPKQDKVVDVAPDSTGRNRFPAALWALPILLMLPGGIIASVIARKKNASWWELLAVGVLTSAIAGGLVYLTQKYAIG